MAKRKRNERRAPGEGAIYQGKDGRWVGAIDLGTINGKRQRRKVYGQTKKEATEKLRALVAQQHDSGAAPLASLTVAQFLDTWLETVVQPLRRPRTVRSYTDTVRLHIVPHVGPIQLAELAPVHVQKLINALAAQGLGRTVNYAHSVLKRALNVALKWGYVARNVAALVEAPQTTRPTITALSAGHARALLDAVAGHRLQGLYQLALGIGARRGELLGLRWADVQLDAGTLAITGAIQWVDGALTRSAPKTAAGRRTIELPPALVDVLRQQQQRQQAERAHAGAKWIESGLVFTSKKGGPLNPYNVLRHFKGALVAAGLPHVAFHALRHTFVSLSLEAGADARTVADIAGHSSVSVTLGTYAHSQPAMRRAAVGAVADLLGRGSAVAPNDTNAAPCTP